MQKLLRRFLKLLRCFCDLDLNFCDGLTNSYMKRLMYFVRLVSVSAERRWVLVGTIRIFPVDKSTGEHKCYNTRRNNSWAEKPGGESGRFYTPH